MRGTADTIVAVATPPGSGGVGIVRLSGPRARTVAQAVAELPGGRPVSALEPRVLTRATLRGAEDLTDRGLIVLFPAPNSYTGEDVVEVHCHGSPLILDALLRRALAGGARTAAPGEFTRRAFLNGRMDLAQAEAVADLITARTAAAARSAGRQLAGGLSRRVTGMRDGLFAIVAELEAGLDFAEEEIDLPSPVNYAARLAPHRRALAELLATAATGALLCEGVTVAIVGRPNVGKSSLFNALLQCERAIVTPEPGTTRDTIDGEIDLDGVPVRLIDTAGVRDAASEAERQGVLRSRAAVAEADVLLWVVDRNAPSTAEDWIVDTADLSRTILLYNKADLPARVARLDAPVLASAEVSATAGTGLDAVHRAMREALHLNGVLKEEAPIIVRSRHREALQRAADALDGAMTSLEGGLTMDCVVLDLREAMDALGALIGATTTEDILNHIFGAFCIGK